MITTSPLRSAGHRPRSTNVSNAGASVAPAYARAAVTPSARAAPASVSVSDSHRACGTVALTRSPGGARPYGRVIAMVAPVSSTYTRLPRGTLLSARAYAPRIARTRGVCRCDGWTDFF